jgi:recombination protein RecA
MKKAKRFPRLAQGEKLVSRSTVLAVVKKINRQFKKKRDEDEDQAASTFENSVFARPKAYVPSGILPVDCIIGSGQGWPTGIVEIFGAEGSGKSAVLEMTLAAAQKKGFYTAIFPMEYSLDDARIRNVGIDTDRLIVLDAETIEDVFDQIKITTRSIRETDPDTTIVFGWDSVAATPCRSELENKKGLEGSNMGRVAQQMSKLFKLLVRFLSKNKVCLICVNQTRASMAMYGPKETTSGGKALRFYAWVRCRIAVIERILNKDKQSIGMKAKLESVKNKTGTAPFQSCILPIYWSRGIDTVEAVWEYGIELEVFRRKGTSYRFGKQIITKKSFKKFYPKNRTTINNLIRNAAVKQVEE